MFCKNCGQQIRPGVKFCGNCGQEIKIGRFFVIKNRIFDWFLRHKIVFFTIAGIVVFVILLVAFNPSSQKYTNNLGIVTTAGIHQNPASTVVNILCDNNMAGSGTILDEKGIILTNNHVVTGSSYCLVTLPNINTGQPQEIYKALPITVPSLSKQYDIAIVKINESFTDKNGKTWGKYPNTFPSFSSPENCNNIVPKLQDKITVYGYPVTSSNSSGLSNLTVTKGIISSFSDSGFILTDTKIDSGNSGGLAINDDGCFIGIPSAIEQGNYQNLGVIIPNNIVQDFFLKAKDSILSAEFSISNSEQSSPIKNNSPSSCDANLIKSDINGACVSYNEYCYEKYGKHEVYNSSNNTCECADGYFNSTIAGHCVSHTTLCSEKYINSIWDGTYCNCPDGYDWNSNSTACIDYNESCAEQFPNTYFGGQYSSDGKRICGCISGYVWNSSNTSCVLQPSCPSNSTYNSNSGKCECWSGYTPVNGYCQSYYSYCQNLNGYGATYNASTNSCECLSGYVFYNSKCEIGYSYCTERWGVGAEYNYSTGGCECGYGYTVNSSRTACVYIYSGY